MQWDQARLNSVKAPRAGAWLNGIPSSTGNTKLSREEFQSRVGRRLGLVLCEETACPLCHQTMDRFGAHAESCVCGGDFTAKHNQTNLHIYKQAKTAGAMPEMEKAKLLAGGSIPNLGRRRPADTLLNSAAGIKTGKQRNRLKVALDVGVVSPQSQSHVVDAAREVLGAATSYTQQKRNHQQTDALCDEAGIDYQPLVFETFGGLCEEGFQTLKSLNRLVAVNTNASNSEVAQRFWQIVSVDLQKACHRAFSKRVGLRGKTLMFESASQRFLRLNQDETTDDT